MYQLFSLPTSWYTISIWLKDTPFGYLLGAWGCFVCVLWRSAPLFLEGSHWCFIIFWRRFKKCWVYRLDFSLKLSFPVDHAFFQNFSNATGIAISCWGNFAISRLPWVAWMIHFDKEQDHGLFCFCILGFMIFQFYLEVRLAEVLEPCGLN